MSSVQGHGHFRVCTGILSRLVWNFVLPIGLSECNWNINFLFPRKFAMKDRKGKSHIIQCSLFFSLLILPLNLTHWPLQSWRDIISFLKSSAEGCRRRESLVSATWCKGPGMLVRLPSEALLAGLCCLFLNFRPQSWDVYFFPSNWSLKSVFRIFLWYCL